MKDMREIVKGGYNQGHYNESFRQNRTLTKLETKFLDELVSRLKPKSKVLDWGCGTGFPYDQYLISRGFEVVGIDFSTTHLELARKTVPAMHTIEGDFTSFEFEDNSFDAIVAFYSIFHVPRDEHKSLFLKARRILKNEGLFLLTLGTSGEEYSEENNWTGGGVMAWSTWTPEDYLRMMNEIDFNIILNDFEGKPRDAEYHFWVLASKQY